MMNREHLVLFARRLRQIERGMLRPELWYWQEK